MRRREGGEGVHVFEGKGGRSEEGAAVEEQENLVPVLVTLSSPQAREGYLTRAWRHSFLQSDIRDSHHDLERTRHRDADGLGVIYCSPVQDEAHDLRVDTRDRGIGGTYEVTHLCGADFIDRVSIIACTCIEGGKGEDGIAVGQGVDERGKHKDGHKDGTEGGAVDGEVTIAQRSFEYSFPETTGIDDCLAVEFPIKVVYDVGKACLECKINMYH